MSGEGAKIPSAYVPAGGDRFRRQREIQFTRCLQPAGEIEAFFDELATLGSTPERKVLQRVFSSHGMELTGPPLPIK